MVPQMPPEVTVSPVLSALGASFCQEAPSGQIMTEALLLKNGIFPSTHKWRYQVPKPTPMMLVGTWYHDIWVLGPSGLVIGSPMYLRGFLGNTCGLRCSNGSGKKLLQRGAGSSAWVAKGRTGAPYSKRTTHMCILIHTIHLHTYIRIPVHTRVVDVCIHIYIYVYVYMKLYIQHLSYAQSWSFN